MVKSAINICASALIASVINTAHQLLLCVIPVNTYSCTRDKLYLTTFCMVKQNFIAVEWLKMV